MSDYSRTNTPGSQMSAGARNDGAKSNSKIITSLGPVNLFTNPNTATIEAMSELQANGYMPQTGPGLSMIQKCEQTMQALGFTMVETEELSPGLEGGLKNFSLIGSVNSDQTIKNSTIFDPGIDLLTPVKDMTNDKFKDQSDTFYDLDEERSESIKKIVEQEKLVGQSSRVKTKIAAVMTANVKYSPNKMLDQVNKRNLIK